MKKRNVFKRTSKLGNSSRRRVLLKRAQQKVHLRRQQFHITELFTPESDPASC